jgi:hypothetical protein
MNLATHILLACRALKKTEAWRATALNDLYHYERYARGAQSYIRNNTAYLAQSSSYDTRSRVVPNLSRLLSLLWDALTCLIRNGHRFEALVPMLEAPLSLSNVEELFLQKWQTSFLSNSMGKLNVEVIYDSARPAELAHRLYYQDAPAIETTVFWRDHPADVKEYRDLNGFFAQTLTRRMILQATASRLHEMYKKHERDLAQKADTLNRQADKAAKALRDALPESRLNEQRNSAKFLSGDSHVFLGWYGGNHKFLVSLLTKL